MATRSFNPWKGHLTIPKRSQRIARTLFFCNCFVSILTGPAQFFWEKVISACMRNVPLDLLMERTRCILWVVKVLLWDAADELVLESLEANMILLMEEILHHLLSMEPYENGIFSISTGWPDSFHQQYLRCCKENDGAKFCSVLPKEAPAPPKIHLQFQAKKIGWIFKFFFYQHICSYLWKCWTFLQVNSSDCLKSSPKKSHTSLISTITCSPENTEKTEGFHIATDAPRRCKCRGCVDLRKRKTNSWCQPLSLEVVRCQTAKERHHRKDGKMTYLKF